MELQPILLASKNSHKIKELQSMLGRNWLVQSIDGLAHPPSWEETGSTFESNARIKVDALSSHTESMILGDDSGLVVDALGGEPGVFSSRYGGDDTNDAKNNAKLLQAMKDIPHHQRTARFVCCLCFLDESKEYHYFTGSCEGIIGFEPSGTHGFGYDPIFHPSGAKRSLAEYTAAEKNAISHRGAALKLFLDHVRRS